MSTNKITTSYWPLMKESITFNDRLKMAFFTLTTKKFTNGEKVKKFEQEWNEWLGSKHSLFVSSGSTANFLLIASVKELYGLKDGDKVLLPACTWVTNIGPIIQLGLQPIFCDINLYNFSFDLDHARKIAKNHEIKMVFVTHLLGLPGENEKLKEIFPNAIILDDVCESHGCLDESGSKVGSNSIGATHSFYFGHHMSTIEGGMVSTNNSELYDLMRMKRSHGMARESLNFAQYAKEHSDIDPQFLFITDGYNFRNHEIPAVLGSSQLKRLDASIEIRKENYKKFISILEKYPNIFHNLEYNENNSSFCFPFICKNKETRERLKSTFVFSDVEYRPVVSGNLLRHPFLSEFNIEPESNNNVELVHKNGLYIGNNQFINDQHMDFLSKILRDF